MTRFDLDMDGSMEPSEQGRWVRYEDAQRKPLSVEQIAELDCNDHYKFARAIEAAHGIKEKNT